ncbi:MAG: hypothetical protein ACRCXD_06515 [Luteolibacter sp.]
MSELKRAASGGGSANCGKSEDSATTFERLACQPDLRGTVCAMRIYQDEIYQKGATFIRIVRLDRYEVEYKTMSGDPKGEGPVAVATKKEFCRLLKGMERVPPMKKAATDG